MINNQTVYKNNNFTKHKAIKVMKQEKSVWIKCDKMFNKIQYCDNIDEVNGKIEIERLERTQHCIDYIMNLSNELTLIMNSDELNKFYQQNKIKYKILKLYQQRQQIMLTNNNTDAKNTVDYKFYVKCMNLNTKKNQNIK
mmetsp:Transcript_105711/g.128991  ORF Transcript_105711/g.128991 Transcript_105711/m.128991 type:complete len:140 (+) Transcript_105711:3-422(+)